MKHTTAPPNPSRQQRRAGEALFNKRRTRELAAMIADQERPGVARFRPATRRARHDGWTAERQRCFIAALADTGSVAQAAGEAGMSRRSAYALRRAPSAQPFRAAWGLALQHASQVMADNATARAVNGYSVAKVYAGEVVHEEVRFNETLVMRLLASRDPYRFGRDPDLAQSELIGEAAATTFDKAMAMIDTELVSSAEGRLSLADAREALDARMARMEREEATDDPQAKKAKHLRIIVEAMERLDPGGDRGGQPGEPPATGPRTDLASDPVASTPVARPVDAGGPGGPRMARHLGELPADAPPSSEAPSAPAPASRVAPSGAAGVGGPSCRLP